MPSAKNTFKYKNRYIKRCKMIKHIPYMHKSKESMSGYINIRKSLWNEE